MAAPVQHLHDFASSQGGYKCQLCTAIITDAEVRANIVNDGHQTAFNDLLNHAWKKAGH